MFSYIVHLNKDNMGNMGHKGNNKDNRGKGKVQGTEQRMAP